MTDTLLDCSTFFINSNVKLLIGLDPNFFLNCALYISTNSQCVKMTVGFYKRLREVLINLNSCSPPTHVLVLLKELKVVSWIRCHRVNVLSIKCLHQDQEVQLTEETVSRFVQLSDAIEEAVQTKVKTRGHALLHVCNISAYLGKQMPIPKTSKLEDVEDYLDRIDVGELKDCIPLSHASIIEELKLKARRQLALGWLASSVVIKPEVNRPFVARLKASRRLKYHKD